MLNIQLERMGWERGPSSAGASSQPGLQYPRPPEKVLSKVWPSTTASWGLGPLAIPILGHQRTPKASNLWDTMYLLCRTKWSRCHDVVVEGRIIELGNRWGREKGMGRGRSVYKQPGTRVDKDRTTQKGQIPRKWEGLRYKGSYQGDSSRGCAMCYNIVNLYICIMLLYECG